MSRLMSSAFYCSVISMVYECLTSAELGRSAKNAWSFLQITFTLPDSKEHRDWGQSSSRSSSAGDRAARQQKRPPQPSIIRNSKGKNSGAAMMYSHLQGKSKEGDRLGEDTGTSPIQEARGAALGQDRGNDRWSSGIIDNQTEMIIIRGQSRDYRGIEWQEAE